MAQRHPFTHEQEDAMTTSTRKSGAVVGDWVEAQGLPGQSTRRGRITEVMGEGAHQHYRVRWDERHESLLYPADGVIVIADRGGSQPVAGSFRT
jgi:hypothetical protein